MHNAPAVTYPVGRSSIQGMIGLALWLLGALSVAAWSMTSPEVWRVAGAAGLTVGVAMLSGVSWWRSRTGLLQWNADGWQLQLGGHWGDGQPSVALDLQRCLVLRWRASRGTGNWLWLDRASAPAHWDDLRRAVYSRAIVDAPPSSRAATP